MISNRQAKEREQRKEQILSSALSVFKKHGIEKATMDEIAKEADFGKATLYYYFSSKEEIFAEQLVRGWRMIWESIEPIVHQTNQPKNTFIDSLNTIGALVRKDQVLFEFLFTAPKALPDAAGESNQDWKNIKKRCMAFYKVFLRKLLKKKNFLKYDRICS